MTLSFSFLGWQFRITPELRDHILVTLWFLVTFKQFNNDELILYPLALYFLWAFIRDFRKLFDLVMRSLILWAFPFWWLLSMSWGVEPMQILKVGPALILTFIICYCAVLRLGPRQIMLSLLIAAGWFGILSLLADPAGGVAARGVFSSKNSLGTAMVMLWIVALCVALDEVSPRWIRLAAATAALLSLRLIQVSSSATAVLLAPRRPHDRLPPATWPQPVFRTRPRDSVPVRMRRDHPHWRRNSFRIARIRSGLARSRRLRQGHDPNRSDCSLGLRHGGDRPTPVSRRRSWRLLDAPKTDCPWPVASTTNFTRRLTQLFPSTAPITKSPYIRADRPRHRRHRHSVVPVADRSCCAALEQHARDLFRLHRAHHPCAKLYRSRTDGDVLAIIHAVYDGRPSDPGRKNVDQTSLTGRARISSPAEDRITPLLPFSLALNAWLCGSRGSSAPYLTPDIPS